MIYCGKYLPNPSVICQVLDHSLHTANNSSGIPIDKPPPPAPNIALNDEVTVTQQPSQGTHGDAFSIRLKNKNHHP